jgi:hypothetical protein
MKAKVLSLIGFIIILMFSCETFIEIEVPPVEQKPVLNCLFAENKQFKVYLSLSMDVNDTTETKIEGASVNLFANGEFIEELADSGNGFYKSGHLAELNSEYRIEASINGFETLIASDALPDEIIIDSVFYEKDAVINAYEGKLYSVANIIFNDNVNIANYYEVALATKHKNPFFDSEGDFTDNNEYIIDYDAIAYSLINDPALNSEDLIGWINSIPFSDKTFNGSKYYLKIPLVLYEFDYEQNFNPEQSLFIIFNITSYNYYKYKSTMDKHIFNQSGWTPDDNILLINSGNPVEMYSNVENGYGIFAGYIQHKVEIKNID